jgi:aspartyl-tRNA(Asn)/glutamyl-tRNA(Gln) amidotransferase subunit B
MAELPRNMAARFQADYGLSEYDATQLTQSLALATYFEAAAKASGQAKLASNWITGELARRLNGEDLSVEQSPVAAETLAKLISRIADSTVSNSAAKQVFDALWDGGTDVDAVIEAKGLKQMNDTGALEAIVVQVIEANAKNVAEFKAGNEKALNGLVGQIMKASKGKANPQQVNDLLRSKLAG